MNVWHFDSQGSAYDNSQCRDSIKDGDLLVTPDAVGFLFKAWAVLVKGEADAFHTVKDGKPETLEGGAYAASVEAAKAQAFSTKQDIEATFDRLATEWRD